MRSSQLPKYYDKNYLQNKSVTSLIAHTQNNSENPVFTIKNLNEIALKN